DLHEFYAGESTLEYIKNNSPQDAAKLISEIIPRFYEEQFESYRHPLSKVRLTAPLIPASIRDFYAFEQHVKAANERRGRDVPAQWYEIPVFYFTNHTAIYAPDETIP